jgi:hypothetical protein
MFEKTREVLRYHANEYDVSAKVWKELKDVENGVKKLLAERKQFKADAELGRAVRKAFEQDFRITQRAYVAEGYAEDGEDDYFVCYEKYIAYEQDLIEWAREQKGGGVDES